MKNYYITRSDGKYRFYIIPQQKRKTTKKKNEQEVALELLLEQDKRK
jgi:hypothetical protein